MCIGWFFVGWGELVIEIIHDYTRTLGQRIGRAAQAQTWPRSPEGIKEQEDARARGTRAGSSRFR